ncbi:MAG TPA: T9SS type A sorting domain-containing protein [Bacteroidales bacterium]|nr:T9SS type A sorting domain-containing protein [Bacteroidales bacterium]
MRNIFAVLSFLMFFSALSAQEILIPSGMNQSIIQQEPLAGKNNRAILTMPFLEDFSATFVYPDPNRFSDSTAFINTGNAFAPISMGVATLDGLDAYGYLYNHGSSFAFAADTLTSYDIRLDSVFTGTPHATSIADSLYFSFFYQPQGLGEKPDVEDSLLLEFYAANQNAWIQVWAAPGSSLNDFIATNGSPWKCVMLPIIDTAFMTDGFRFRFRNYASYADLSFPTWASNADFWNIDYIILDSERDAADSVPTDLAFGERHETLLKKYFSMPWNHFLANSAAEMSPEINAPYANLSESLLNVTERLTVDDLSGTTGDYDSGLSASNLNPLTDTAFYRSPIPYTFSSSVSKNAEFEVNLSVNTATIGDPVASNDTLAFYQRFYNYFAPDDGSCEAGYGLTVNSARAAYMFTLNMPDTLQSVQMFFNRVVNDANQIYFYLTIWDDNGGVPGNIIYQQMGVRPEFEHGFNAFHTYVLDNPLPVSGRIYVGWQQTSSEVLNLGYDLNNDRSGYFFYNVDGNWYNTLYAGTPMIRIIVGDSPYQHVGMSDTETLTSVFPNPCNDCAAIQFNDNQSKTVSVIDLNGRVVKRIRCDNTMSTEDIAPGYYTLMIEKNAEHPVFVKWILTK